MNDCLFFGRNKEPILLKNKPKKITKPIQFKFENENENENENEKQIKKISSGESSTIFLFKNGKAIEYLNKRYYKDLKQNPSKIQIEENIQKVTGGYFNEAILTIEGNVFAKGEEINENNPNEFINISSLIKDTNDRIIQDVVSGYNSIYLLTSNHNVYGIGSNFYGQLGVGTLKKAEKPILMMKNVSKIFSGTFSTFIFLLNSNQELFGCGWNHYGQLGLGDTEEEWKIKKPIKIQNIPKGEIIDIKCGYEHSIMLIEDQNENENPKRKLYSCGDYEYNGLGKEDENTYEFTEIKSSLFENNNIIDFSCRYKHTLILTSNSKLIGFGLNDYGQLGTGDTKYQSIPIQIELPELRFDENISNYHIHCGFFKSFIYYSPPSFSNLEEDLIKLFGRKEFCDISFKTENGEIIEAHKLILKYRLKDQNQNEKLQEIISKKSFKESNQIFEMIYSNRIINPKLYSEIKEIINSNEKIEETMKRIYLNENENEKDFIIERKEKQYKFPKLILIMRSELYRGMFLSVTEDTSNKVTDYSELSNKSFQIFEYWIYSNQIKEGIQITQEIIDELETGIDYFQLNQTNPNLIDLLIKKFNNQNQNNKKEKIQIEKKKEKSIEYLNKNPSKIQIEENIQKVTVCDYNEAILTIEGNVFAKGEDINSENPNEFINISSLIEDRNDRIIKDIVSGANSIYLLTSNQNVYRIGSNQYAQLGFDSKTLQETEKPILMMKNVSKIFSGNYSFHAFLLNSNQELFFFEVNLIDQLKLSDYIFEEKTKKLTKIQNIPKGKIIDIQCGNTHSIMLIENQKQNPKRKLYSFLNYGAVEFGRTKIKKEFTEIKSSLFENDDNILDFSVGHNHTLILTSNSKLIGFGLNDFGRLGTGDTNDQLIPIQIELPKLRFNEEISNYHIHCGFYKSFIYYSSPPFSNLEEDLIKLFERKEFCDISFKTKNGEIIEAHKLILKYRLNQNQNEIEKLKEIISKKSFKESNQIFEMIYSNRIINPKLYSEIKEIINSNEKIEETMKRIYLNENENENEKDFIIERKEKKYKFPKLILIMRSELYRGMFLSVTEDKSNKVRDYSELSNKSFQIFEYWIYSNQIKDEIQITQEIIDELKRGI
ncbi:hypothetical protein M0811_04578 [Anaeramoeba ignava]|uniref:BTB domain-containing protein n=1 Tax=Anaeramoeba ignava TaxID=1746090 RepID=A0A9Q0LVX8_ANAIG|nr:hypothetical protein M0811_04578 [Anaeramoeba ignava]